MLSRLVKRILPEQYTAGNIQELGRRSHHVATPEAGLLHPGFKLRLGDISTESLHELGVTKEARHETRGKYETWPRTHLIQLCEMPVVTSLHASLTCCPSRQIRRITFWPTCLAKPWAAYGGQNRVCLA